MAHSRSCPHDCSACPKLFTNKIKSERKVFSLGSWLNGYCAVCNLTVIDMKSYSCWSCWCKLSALEQDELRKLLSPYHDV